MANGNHALKLLELEPPAPVCAKATASAAPTGIEVQIGQATCAAVLALAQAMLDYQRGELDPKTREAGGSAIAAVAMVQLEHDLDDLTFATMAHAAGTAAVQRRFNANFDRTAADDAEINRLINTTLKIVSKVVADERTYRAVRAH